MHTLVMKGERLFVPSLSGDQQYVRRQQIIGDGKVEVGASDMVQR
jgi:hypothetical protein